MEIKEQICANCGKPKSRHYEAPTLEGEKPIFECEIVRDSGKNYRFKKIKKCTKCKKNKPIEYEEIGQGRYCQDCLDEEHEIYLKEGGI